MPSELFKARLPTCTYCLPIFYLSKKIFNRFTNLLLPFTRVVVMAITIICFQALSEKAKSVPGIHQWPYRAVAHALEVIPRTLIQNCGGSVIRTLTALKVRSVGKISN